MRGTRLPVEETLRNKDNRGSQSKNYVNFVSTEKDRNLFHPKMGIGSQTFIVTGVGEFTVNGKFG